MNHLNNENLDDLLKKKKIIVDRISYLMRELIDYETLFMENIINFHYFIEVSYYKRCMVQNSINELAIISEKLYRYYNIL